MPEHRLNIHNYKPIVFDQWNRAWRNRMYSNHGDASQTIASSGSVPTLCADVVATMKGMNNVDPHVLAEQAVEWGCRTYNTGTTYSFFEKVARHYDFKRFVASHDFNDMRECLDLGGYVICHMKPFSLWWPATGPYVLAWKFDDDYVYCVTTSRRDRREKQRIKNFQEQANSFFCFYPDTLELEENE